MNQEKIGKFIAQKRKEKNLTQVQFAEKLGVSDRSVSKWENGRCMPDLSLFEPICTILEISINEFLSGEEIPKEKYEKKAEENMLQTIDYTGKKIKHTKTIYMTIFGVVLLLIATLPTLFCIDITRMRNNEPVLFSTWGYEYVPPINLDVENMEKCIREYLVKEEEKNKHYNNEKSFAAMRTYFIDEKSEEKYYVYAWILQEAYYEKDGKIEKDTAYSIPHKFELTKEDDNYIVTDYTIPRDGEYYERDIKNIFPKSVLNDMEDVHTDGTIERLQLEIDEKVELYFHK